MTLGNTPPHPLMTHIHNLAVQNCRGGKIPKSVFGQVRNRECVRNYLKENEFIEMLNTGGTCVAYLASADWRKEYLRERV